MVWVRLVSNNEMGEGQQYSDDKMATHPTGRVDCNQSAMAELDGHC